MGLGLEPTPLPGQGAGVAVHLTGQAALGGDPALQVEHLREHELVGRSEAGRGEEEGEREGKREVKSKDSAR